MPTHHPEAPLSRPWPTRTIPVSHLGKKTHRVRHHHPWCRSPAGTAWAAASHTFHTPPAVGQGKLDSQCTRTLQCSQTTAGLGLGSGGRRAPWSVLQTGDGEFQEKSGLQAFRVWESKAGKKHDTRLELSKEPTVSESTARLPALPRAAATRQCPLSPPTPTLPDLPMPASLGPNTPVMPTSGSPSATPSLCHLPHPRESAPQVIPSSSLPGR